MCLLGRKLRQLQQWTCHHSSPLNNFNILQDWVPCAITAQLTAQITHWGQVTSHYVSKKKCVVVSDWLTAYCQPMRQHNGKHTKKYLEGIIIKFNVENLVLICYTVTPWQQNNFQKKMPFQIFYCHCMCIEWTPWNIGTKSRGWIKLVCLCLNWLYLWKVSTLPLISTQCKQSLDDKWLSLFTQHLEMFCHVKSKLMSGHN